MSDERDRCEGCGRILDCSHIVLCGSCEWEKERSR